MAKILIVDDQTCIQQFYQEELSEDGYDVAVADDVSQAMAKIESHRPDVVVLDLFLKGSNGWEALDMIKKNNSHLPVIIATAYDSYQEDPRLKEAAGYIVKSFDVTELKEKISELLVGHRREEYLLHSISNTFAYGKVA
ncbi:MAG: response regulator [Deltaproteobacteria bacterium]|nr:response regulator [Deltaproteobacteria bacterium]